MKPINGPCTGPQRTVFIHSLQHCFRQCGEDMTGDCCSKAVRPIYGIYIGLWKYSLRCPATKVESAAIDGSEGAT